MTLQSEPEWQRL